jgi:hypothetical protein
MVPCPLTFPCRLEAPTSFGPISFVVAFASIVQVDLILMGDLVFNFTLGAYEGLCPSCIPPFSSNLGKCLKYLSYNKWSFTPKASNHVRRTISSHIPPLGGAQSTFDWSLACRWPKSLLRPLGWAVEAPSYLWALNGVMWTFYSFATWTFSRWGF